jgi:inorganic pyrophosphatase
VIHRTNDEDDKLIVCTPGTSFTDAEIRTLTRFQERWFVSVILR